MTTRFENGYHWTSLQLKLKCYGKFSCLFSDNRREPPPAPQKSKIDPLIFTSNSVKATKVEETVLANRAPVFVSQFDALETSKGGVDKEIEVEVEVEMVRGQLTTKVETVLANRAPVFCLMFQHSRSRYFFRSCCCHCHKHNSKGLVPMLVTSYDYSVYGQSSGKPCEQNTYADIEAAYKCLEESYGAKQFKLLF